MKKGMRGRVSGDDVCDCCCGEQLDNKKPFRPLNIFKHMLKNNFVLFIRECRITYEQNEIGMCCFSAIHAALRIRSKVWLNRNQDNVSKWSDMLQ